MPLPSDLCIATIAAGQAVGEANPLFGWRAVGGRGGGDSQGLSEEGPPEILKNLFYFNLRTSSGGGGWTLGFS